MAFTEPTDGHGERPAIVDGRGVNTHADLSAAAARVATSLAGPNGDASGARVALLIAPGFEFAAVLRGVWRAGGVAVPLAVTDPAAELDYVLRDSGADTLVTGQGFAHAIAPLAAAADVQAVHDGRPARGGAEGSGAGGRRPPRADRLLERDDGQAEGGRPHARERRGPRRVADIGVGVDGRRSHAAGPAAPSRARPHQRALLRDGRGRLLRDAAAIRRRRDVGPARLGRDHGLHRGPDDLSPADRGLGGGARGAAPRLVGRRPARAADDVRIGRLADRDARAVAGDHGPGAARALRAHRGRHGAVESARR